MRTDPRRARSERCYDDHGPARLPTNAPPIYDGTGRIPPMRYPPVPRDLAAIAVLMRTETDDPELPSMVWGVPVRRFVEPEPRCWVTGRLRLLSWCCELLFPGAIPGGPGSHRDRLRAIDPRPR